MVLPKGNIMMSELTQRDRVRYQRQMLILGWGEEGQRRVKKAKVFVAGAGGLGSPASIYLVVAGVGHLRIVDHDTPELSNLNRQILHTETDIGKAKAQSAEEALKALNPDIVVEGLRVTIAEENVVELAGDADVIVDCMDNFPTRYLLNEAALELGIPLVHGSIWGMEGRCTFIIPGQTPCLRCIFQEAPPREVFPVLGTAPGVIGCIQAAETLKYLTGLGQLLTNRLLIYDGLTTSFTEVKLRRDLHCPSCGGR